MRLDRVEISDYRSIFADDGGAPLNLDLAEGMNVFVGTNNTGKSNILRAVALALDPHYRFEPTTDNPGPRRFAHPTITLRFLADRNRDGDRNLLAAAWRYEDSVSDAPHFADDDQVVLQVRFEPTEGGVRRRELLLAKGDGLPVTAEADALLEAALAELREAVRFVLISSGESIRSVLDGNFREILHSVVKEQLADAFEQAEKMRIGYLDGLQDSLLGPLRDRLISDVSAMFPEIRSVSLEPEVPPIDRTLSNVRVALEDLVATPLSEKGTGTRGGVLVAMLAYLASNATRAMIFAVEEPEAFLHPSAQEDLRDQIEQIGLLDGITLLVTTHSPHIITRSPRGKVFGVAKDEAGRTRIGSAIPGDGEHSEVVSALFRESTFEELLSRATGLPAGADALLIVEGAGDKECLELASRVVGRPDLLDGLAIRPAGSALKTVVQAVVARAALEPRPVLVLLDNDDAGRAAYNQLTGGTFRFKKTAEVTTYAEVFPASCQNFPIEAEDLFDSALWEGFIEQHGREIIKEMVKRPDGQFHFGFDPQAKEELVGAHLRTHTRPAHVVRWIDLILSLRVRAGLTVPSESAEEIVAAVGAGDDSPRHSGRALIVTGKLDYARYLRSSVLVLDTTARIDREVSHVGFYADGEIKPEIAEVLQHYAAIRISEETIAQLRSTGKADDEDLAHFAQLSLQRDDDLAGATRQLILLSASDDGRTLRLGQPIKNNRQKAGRPLAWAISPQVIPMGAVVSGPMTTTDLDELIAEMAPSEAIRRGGEERP